MKIRTLLFWLHLACGLAAGAVILIMSVTGVLLTYQRQITAWADMRGYHAEPPAGIQRLPVDELIARVSAVRPGLTPATVVLRSDPSLPASMAIGAGRQIFVNPYTGAVLGDGNGEQVRAFFRSMVEWHRYVAMAGERRPAGKAITGASNLMFLFIVLSGMYLWWPRSLTWAAVRHVTWFRRGLPGKARDFNWHNTIGFWSAIPLAVIVCGGVVISYPWATALVYRAYGEQPPPARAANAGDTRLQPDEAVVFTRAVDTASAHMADWRTLSIALPAPNANRVVLTLDSGDGGQPHKRATLTLDRKTGEVVRWEPYSAQPAGRRARTWLRFAHTGEIYGLPGQTIAGIVTAGAAVLVWTGLALAFRRWLAWRKRGRAELAKAA
jgi:uncharacterized iron-regulated membrane protein